jgi:hypothetical protein
MTATQFYGGGGNLTGVGVDGIVSTANATAITIDVNENVGLGVTPKSTWSSDFSVLQLGGSAALWGHSLYAGYLSQNVYNDGGYKYLSTSGASLILMNYPGIKFRTAASGTADTAITWNTGLEVLNSGKARAKNGIMFGTDTSDSNTLDDYEEGTWTPRLFKSATEVTSPSSNDGIYRKIGGLIFLSCYFVKPSGTNTTTGNWELKGMPYSLGVSSPFGYQSGSVGYWKMNGAYQNPPGSGDQLNRWQSNSTGILTMYGKGGSDNWTSGNIVVSMSGIFAVA